VKKRKPEDALEEYLNERTVPDDPELAALARAADRLERSLNVEAPEAYRERALFIQGVAARRPGFPWARLMVPVMAASMLVAFVAISRDARPGDTLYGVRTALDNVGLAEDPEDTAADLLRDAEAKVEEGEDRLDAQDFVGARAAADAAIRLADEAQDLLHDASGEPREEGLSRVFDVKDDARDLYAEVREERRDLRQEELEAAAEQSGGDHGIGDDNSGPGSDDSGGDDNSGSGSDDSGGDDNSGSGSDDSGGDDNSGSGSDDPGGDDSSGSGSGSDD
jgi:hypothetical protein